MIEIVPALMPKSFEELRTQLESIRGAVRSVQIDVMDGRYVPSQSWPYIGDREAFDAIAAQSVGLPNWEHFDFEIDLMVEDVIVDAASWIAAGAARIVVHIEHSESIAAIKEIIALEGAPPGARTVEIGVALNSDTPIEKLDPIADAVDFIQCMGIARIGYQGEPFDSRVLGQLAALRERHPDRILSVDGGVSTETIPELVSAGATRLIAGSAIWRSPSPRDAIAELRARI